MIFLTNINLSKNELQNAVIQPLAVAPSNPKLGQIYTDSVDSRIKWYNGTSWMTIGVVVESSETNGSIIVDGIEMSVYELPIASATKLGGVKVGTGLAIDENGVLHATGGGTADAVEWENVLNKPTTFTPSAHNHDDRYYTESEVNTELAKKVDKITGKGLSTNDYTTTEKQKLAAIAAGAEVNVNADWDATSGDAQILNKPTTLSEFTNDEGFIDNTVNNLVNYYLKSETYTQTEVNTLIGNLATIQIQVVTALPATGSSNIIYLVAKTVAEATNIYDEYIWIASSSSFEKVGDTKIDLSNYLQKTGDGSNVTATFSSAASRTLPVTGEKIAIIIGKIIKYLTDLKTVAFSGSYSDLDGKPDLVKTSTLTLTTTETTKSTTITGGSVILGVTIYDNVTHEVVLCDVTINGMTVTINVSAAPSNILKAVISYI